MLSTRLEMLLDEIDADNTEIAALSHCSPSNISRLKSGKRAPGKATTTICSVAKGVCLFCEENDLTDKLKTIIGSSAVDREALSKDLVDWLFSTDPAETEYRAASQEEKATYFSAKLTSVMQLAEVSNSKLSRAVNIDASYISRFKNGKRKPKTSSKLLANICSVLAVRLTEQNKLDKLADLIGDETGALDSSNSAKKLKKWLLSTEPSPSTGAVEKLLEGIRRLPRIIEDGLPDINEIMTDERLKEKNEYYYGDDGLQSAALRLLTTAALDGEQHTMIFYSDKVIQWFTGDFAAKWLGAMKECIARGAKVIIVHNLERSPTELTNAVKDWLPLYTIGTVESYFSSRPCGTRFKHTIFLDVGKRMVFSCAPYVADYEPCYYYVTDSRGLEEAGKAFNSMIADCSPFIMPFNEDLRKDRSTHVYRYEEIEIFVSADSVSIINTQDKRAAFSFRSPQLCSAIRSFAEKNCKKL